MRPTDLTSVVRSKLTLQQQADMALWAREHDVQVVAMWHARANTYRFQLNRDGSPIAAGEDREPLQAFYKAVEALQG